MMIHRFLYLAAVLLLFAAPASAQTFYAAFDDGATTEFPSGLPNGYPLSPPADDQYPAVAHLKVGTAAVIDSNTLNVLLCNEVIVSVVSGDYTGNDGDFFVMRTTDAAKTASTRILADIDGDGVIEDDDAACANDLGDCVPLDGDDGTDVDGDSTKRQTSAMYGISEEYIWLDQGTQNATDSVYAKVICK